MHTIGQPLIANETVHAVGQWEEALEAGRIRVSSQTILAFELMNSAPQPEIETHCFCKKSSAPCGALLPTEVIQPVCDFALTQLLNLPTKLPPAHFKTFGVPSASHALPIGSQTIEGVSDCRENLNLISLIQTEDAVPDELFHIMVLAAHDLATILVHICFGQPKPPQLLPHCLADHTAARARHHDEQQFLGFQVNRHAHTAPDSETVSPAPAPFVRYCKSTAAICLARNSVSHCCLASLPAT